MDTIEYRPKSPVRKTQRRTTRACDDCRRLKEKCIGSMPCNRCKYFGRPCQFSEKFRRSRVSRITSAQTDKVAAVEVPSKNVSVYSEAKRIQALEHIVRHYTGLEEFSIEKLETVITDLSSLMNEEDLADVIEVEIENDHVSNDGKDCASIDTVSTANAEFSHQEFSRRIQKKVKDELDDFEYEDSGADTAVSDKASPSRILSRDSAVLEAVSLFPPAPSALVLLRVFFEVAQTNYFYIDEETLRQCLDQFYSYPTHVDKEDASWVSVALMVFALGTQFSHLYQSSVRGSNRELMRDAHEICQTMDDTIASIFYRKATNLIPDILAMGSIESVQAFLLFGIYVLPIDPAGLSCTYFGIAIKVATQFNLHQKTTRDASPREVELQKRVWWTAYALERRICILHGRPVSISRLDIDANLPIDLEELQPKERINTFQNNMAMLKLTIFMEDARDGILALKSKDKAQKLRSFQNIAHLKARLRSYWQSLSEETFCRDLTPGKPLFRSNVHLFLTYHLIHILIGRSFILDELNINTKDTPSAEWTKLRKELVNDCINSAVATFHLCQTLHDESSLSKSSYTEFSSCCAAVLALVAKCVSDRNSSCKDACKKGMELLREISTGVFSTSGEKRTVEGLEIAFERLNHAKGRDSAGRLDEDGYLQFRNWVAMQQIVPGETLELPRQENPMFEVVGGSSLTYQCSGMAGGYKSGCSLPARTEVISLPDLGDWFDHGFEQPVA
ncbi:thiamine repressible regulatory thi1 [Fusarium beomiforme]|uniref:Thiamine repressible regulatory thi1 n=1 Tax=Fusarium beomiforme TaxID=44412 RepID=A0A9P5AVH6_9HYPO|nr:thiamine repressible regulatory thi1 [Fusarium beomiforme]